MSGCVRGCTVRGEHVPDCDGTVVREGARTECSGCLPRQADVGVLCLRCWGRLVGRVRTLPALAAHLEAMSELGARSVSAGGGVRRPGEGGLYPQAAGVLDEVHAVLATWCVQVALEREVTIPARGTRWTVADGEGLREPIGPAWPGATARLAAWIDQHLQWCASQYWAGDLLDDLHRACSRAEAAFPLEQAERVSPVACPACGCPGLLVAPPQVAGGQVQARCRSCGLVLAEADWEQARRQALAIAQASQPGGRVFDAGAGVGA